MPKRKQREEKMDEQSPTPTKRSKSTSSETKKEKKPRKESNKKPPKSKAATNFPSAEEYKSQPHYKLRETDRWVGAHVSAAAGVYNAIYNAAEINANSFALFLKSQRQWSAKPISDQDAEKFKTECANYGFKGDQILPHGSYLVNLGNPDPEKREKSYGAFVDDLKRCEQLGILLFNFHPGSTVGGCTKKESIEYIADAINRAHKDTESVIIVIENMADQGNVIGGFFQDLRDIIDLVENKKRVGVCIDTCHMFAAGYDIRTKTKFDATFAEFEKVVGFNYLKALHLNDSKSDLGSKLDRHESIGQGKIGSGCFEWIMKDERFKGIPMILETPESTLWKKEISMLYDHLGEEGKGKEKEMEEGEKGKEQEKVQQ